MQPEIDFIAYARAPRLDNIAALMLAKRLAQAAPLDASPMLKTALRNIHTAAQKLDTAQTERDRLRPESLVRYDQAFDAAWGALHARLVGTAKLPMHISRDSERAARLLATLFPDGLEFVKADFDREYIEGNRLLSRIDDEGLKDDLERIAGADCMKAIRVAQTEFGEALGVGRSKKERASSTAVQEALSVLLKAIATYTRVLAAEVDEDDVASRTRFFAAVAPIDDARSNRKPSGREDGEDVEGTDTEDEVVSDGVQAVGGSEGNVEVPTVRVEPVVSAVG